MTEPTTDTAVDTTDAQEAPTEQQPEPKTYTEDEVKKLRDEAAKWRTKLREEEQARRASMTDTERAIAEAREAAAAEVRTQYGSRLAQTEFKAAAAARNADYDVAAALEFVDLRRFLGEDGEPDTKAIAKAVERLVPAATQAAPTPPSFDGGTRQSAPAGQSMTDLIRQAAGRG